MQSWLGTANQYRKYIQHYAEITKPLYDMMGLKNVDKKFRIRNGAVDGSKVNIEWNKETNEHFDRLNVALCSGLLLMLPNFDEIMFLTIDACDYGYGAVLEQLVDGEFKPIAFFSKSYTQTQ